LLRHGRPFTAIAELSFRCVMYHSPFHSHRRQTSLVCNPIRSFEASSHAQHRCGLLRQMSHIAWSACLRDCVQVLQKPLYRSRCRLRVTGVGPRNKISYRMGQFWTSVRPTEKHCEVTAAYTAAKNTNDISAASIQPTALVPIGRYHINSPMKHPLPVLGPLVKISLTTCYYSVCSCSSVYGRPKLVTDLRGLSPIQREDKRKISHKLCV